jgi:hypothetical protein
MRSQFQSRSAIEGSALRFCRAALLILFIGLTSSADVAALSCGGPVGHREWVETLTSMSTYVFYARVTKVSPNRLDGSIGETVTVRVKRQFKGSMKLPVIEATFTTNFRPARGEHRIFFVDKNGTIISCSEYKRFTTDQRLMRDIVSVLRDPAPAAARTQE